MTQLATRRSVRAASRARRRARPRDLVVVTTIALVGIAVLLYPAAASWLSAWEERGAVTGYVERVAELPTDEIAAALEAARQYNTTLDRGLIVDPFSNTSSASPELDADAQAYLDQLDIDPSGVMARIQIPKIDVDLPVFHGATDETLRRGVGHLYGSSMPVGGPGTHAVLTGHSGLPEARLFDDLRRLEIGDEFSITTLGETFTYRVGMIDTVDPTDIADLGTSAGRDLVTLVTCTPIGINSHRLIVQGERVENASATAEVLGADAVDFPWWAVVLGVAVVVWLIPVVRAIRSIASRDRG